MNKYFMNINTFDTQKKCSLCEEEAYFSFETMKINQSFKDNSIEMRACLTHKAEVLEIFQEFIYLLNYEINELRKENY